MKIGGTVCWPNGINEFDSLRIETWLGTEISAKKSRKLSILLECVAVQGELLHFRCIQFVERRFLGRCVCCMFGCNYTPALFTIFIVCVSWILSLRLFLLFTFRPLSVDTRYTAALYTRTHIRNSSIQHWQIYSFIYFIFFFVLGNQIKRNSMIWKIAFDS